MTEALTFILDIDGTLTADPEFAVAPKDVEAVTSLVPKHRVLLATGRPLSRASQVARALAVSDILMTSNGALSVQGATVHTFVPLNKAQGLHVIALCKQHGFNAYVVTARLADGRVDEHEVHVSEFVDSDAALLNIHLHSATEDEKDRWIAVLQTEPQPDLTVKNSGATIIEVFNKTVTKGAILRKLYGEGKISGKIVYVGDSDNDIEAIQFAKETGGYGIAMGNAFPAVKDAASFVTRDVHENGVAWAIEWVLAH